MYSNQENQVSDKPKEQLKLIQEKLENQLKIIKQYKEAQNLSAEKNQYLDDLHNALQKEFKDYLQDLESYLKKKNKFFEICGDNWQEKKNDLMQQLGSLAYNSRETPNDEQTKSKQENITKKIRDGDYQLEEWNKAVRTFNRDSEKFKLNCLAAIKKVPADLVEHGNWRDIVNYLVSLIAVIAKIFEALRFKTTAEKTLDEIEHQIDDVINEANDIDADVTDVSMSI